jgi:hypothetical protein
LVKDVEIRREQEVVELVQERVVVERQEIPVNIT